MDETEKNIEHFKSMKDIVEIMLAEKFKDLERRICNLEDRYNRAENVITKIGAGILVGIGVSILLKIFTLFH